MQKLIMVGLCFFFSLFLMNSEILASNLKVQATEVVVAQERSLVKILFNLYPHLNDLRGYKSEEREKVILDSLRSFLQNDPSSPKDAKSYEVNVVLIKTLDEYARPDYANKVSLGEVKFNSLDKADQNVSASIDLPKLDREIKG